MAPIVGVDLPVLDEDGASLARVVVLAHGHNKGLGWATLCAVVSEAHALGKKKQFGIKRSKLSQLVNTGLVSCTVLLGPDSDVAKATLGRSKTAALKALKQWLVLFDKPGALGIEIVSLLTEPGKLYSSDQASRMLELADAIRDELGSAQAEAFTSSVKPALEALYSAMESTRTTLTQGVGMLTGEAEPAEPMGAEPAMEPTVDAEAGAELPSEEGGEDFAAAEPAAGGDEELGRAKRESIEYSRRLGTILSSKKK
jgi:hypothetical protein